MTKANVHRRRTSMTVHIWSWIAIPSVTKIDNSSLITKCDATSVTISISSQVRHRFVCMTNLASTMSKDEGHELPHSY
jgi:hypothetical protein